MEQLDTQDLLDLISTTSNDRIAAIIAAEWGRGDSRTRSWNVDLYVAAGAKTLECGQVFLGYDILNEGLKRYCENPSLTRQKALALARLGETQEAQTILLGLYNQGDTHPDTLGILARTYKDQWMRKRDNRLLLKAHDIYLKGFDVNNDAYNGINAATLSLLIGEHKKAKQIALSVIKICKDDLVKEKGTTNHYWLLATLGEAYLITGDIQESAANYVEAFRQPGRAQGNQASTIRQARLIIDYLKSHKDRAHIDVDKPGFSELNETLQLGKLAVCIGHMIDRPDRKDARFPPYLENEVRKRIRESINTLDARIGYCSAACGADILFAEEMLKRNAEVHINLPFRREDFIEASVSFAGEGWVERFHSVIKQATSVTEPVREAYLGDDCLFDYGSEVMIGKAFLHADMLELSPILFAVWNGRSGDGRGGTADVVNSWKSRYGNNVVYIDIGHTASSGEVSLLVKKPAPSLPQSPANLKREIKSMLFADVMGYSKLLEAQHPYFIYQFLGAVGHLIQSEKFKSIYRNTWGDGLFCVFECASDTARFALELRDLVLQTNWEKHGLPVDTNIRIALHSGPVYSGIDPVTKTNNYYGLHVSRSARLEPITRPGSVYVSEPFAALLRAEKSPDFLCEYIGIHMLAKDYGEYPLYLLRRRSELD